MISVSIVSHEHGDMVWDLVRQVLDCSEVSQLIVTLNLPEEIPVFSERRLLIVRNDAPKGFGENHNAAFKLADGDFFCVLNPDIVFTGNPFFELMSAMQAMNVGVSAPLILGPAGQLEDSMRVFLTPLSLLKRIFGLSCGACSIPPSCSSFNPDWVAGMFMFFRSTAYAAVNGFDERYFMYCEDADICTRLWHHGYAVVGSARVSAIHNARRASHRSWKHLKWHIRSMLLYLVSHSFSLPRKDAVISLS